MKRTTKYVALDVHQASTVFSVRAAEGRVIARTIMPTEASAIVEFFQGLRGTIYVGFEEGTQAQWLHDLITPLVARVVGCDQRGQHRRGNKNDLADADELSEQLRRGGLSAVYHGNTHCVHLKELTRAYQNLVEDATRVMLRLKALFRALPSEHRVRACTTISRNGLSGSLNCPTRGGNCGPSCCGPNST